MDRIKTEPGKREYLEIIIKETERLKRIINNILDFSKREKGKIEYKTEKVNVTELIHSALKDLNYWLVEKDFTVQTELEENINIKADRDAIKQVIINLLDNAIKYSGDRREINIRLSSDHKKIRMEFEDKGIGIPENQHNSIFEKFYRVSETASDGISGTGLGLTVVKEIIEAHNGEISVESKPDEGSKFTVLLNSS
jgi:signal transduction histidine kinase